MSDRATVIESVKCGSKVMRESGTVQTGFHLDFNSIMFKTVVQGRKMAEGGVYMVIVIVAHGRIPPFHVSSAEILPLQTVP